MLESPKFNKFQICEYISVSNQRRISDFRNQHRISDFNKKPGKLTPGRIDKTLQSTNFNKFHISIYQRSKSA